MLAKLAQSSGVTGISYEDGVDSEGGVEEPALGKQSV